MAFQGDSIYWVEVEKIVANPYQPRREFDENRLKELSESVRMYGILQPLTVTRREIQNGDGSFRTEYELIAGERRLRASKLAGLTLVPVIIRDGEQSEQEKLELAIIENLQREDLNAVDRALAFRQLADVFGLSHGQVAQKVGRSREYVSNSIRLLALPDYMLSSLRLGDISEGHARTLLMLNDRPEEQDTVFRETLLKKLSVRELERIARGIATEKVRKKEHIDDELLDLERKFTETLGTRVSIVKTDFGGKMTIDYFSQEDLVAILERMRTEGSLVSATVSETESNPVLAAITAATPLASVEAPVPEVLVKSVSDASFPVPYQAPEVPQVRPEVLVPQIVVPPLVPTVSVPAQIETVVPPVPVVVPPAPVVIAAPAPSVPSSPLRDKLASLLGRSTATPAAASSVVAAAVVSAPSAPVVTVTPPTAPEVLPKPAADDSDLYSINSFTI